MKKANEESSLTVAAVPAAHAFRQQRPRSSAALPWWWQHGGRPQGPSYRVGGSGANRKIKPKSGRFKPNRLAPGVAIQSPEVEDGRAAARPYRGGGSASQWQMALPLLPVVTSLLPGVLPLKFLSTNDVTDVTGF